MLEHLPTADPTRASPPTCDSYEGTEDEQTIRSLDENMIQRSVTLLVAYETGGYL